MFDLNLSWGLLQKHQMIVRFIALTLIHVINKEFLILRQKQKRPQWRRVMWGSAVIASYNLYKALKIVTFQV